MIGSLRMTFLVMITFEIQNISFLDSKQAEMIS